MEVEAFRDLVEALAHHKAVLGEGDLDQALRCFLAVDYVLERRAQLLIERAPERPLLAVYMNDGWSAPVSEITTLTQGGHLVRVEGRYKHEFLLERVLYRSPTAGADDLAVLLRPPRALGKGKTACHLFMAGCEFYEGARCRGHEGL